MWLERSYYPDHILGILNSCCDWSIYFMWKRKKVSSVYNISRQRSLTKSRLYYDVYQVVIYPFVRYTLHDKIALSNWDVICLSYSMNGESLWIMICHRHIRCYYAVAGQDGGGMKVRDIVCWTHLWPYLLIDQVIHWLVDWCSPGGDCFLTRFYRH